MFDEYKKELKELQDTSLSRFDDFQKFLDEQRSKLAKIQRMTNQQEEHAKMISSFVSKEMNIDEEVFRRYLKKPYKMVRVSEGKYKIYVPKWVPNFQVGWLIDHGKDDEFYTYEINRYSSWLGDVPAELIEKLDLEPQIEAKVANGKVTFDKKHMAEDLFKGHISRWGISNADIKAGHEFDVILRIIESGGIPYDKYPVDPADTRRPEVTFTLYDYQKKAVQLFRKTGAVGVFYPTGAGKSMIAMQAMDELQGRKIIVTTKTLIQQWEYYFEKFAPRLREETNIVTYELVRSRPELMRNRYVLAVFDECHKLPANSFAKLSLLNCKYRIGLSASPHREDGNEKMIFALTGYSIGINWKEYMEKTGRKYHPIHIHLTSAREYKMRKIAKLLNPKKKTLIYSDSLDLGHAIAERFNIPFVHGETENRMQIIKENKVCVVSRVLDHGASIDDLERIIEADFLFGSRQQELQRTGRLMHSSKAERHDILMTEKEFEQHSKRLWVLEEKGFHVKVHE